MFKIFEDLDFEHSYRGCVLIFIVSTENL